MLRKKKRQKKTSFTLPANPYRQKYVTRALETWAAHRQNLTDEPMPARFINLNSHMAQRLDVREVLQWQRTQKFRCPNSPSRARKPLFATNSRTVTGRLLSLNDRISSQIDPIEISQWITESKVDYTARVLL